MPSIDELSRVIGKLENGIETLFHKQTSLCKEVKALNIDVQDKVEALTKTLQKRKLWDTVKVVFGAFLGGVAAMAAKLAIWE